jgi:hypothetical protein
MTYLIEEINTVSSIDMNSILREFTNRNALYHPFCDMMQVLHSVSPTNHLVQEWIYKRVVLFMEGLD